jgi:uncharacterized damage-inducible protein DinB
MHRTQWFDRTFAPIADNGLLPSILERLDGTPARLRGKLALAKTHLAPASKDGWSIKKEVGHLLDLEPLWYERALQIIGGEGHLIKADLTNRKTHEADHDAAEMENLIAAFAAEREKLVTALAEASDADLEKSALHPRLGTPMRLIDLAFFVAEHDDHHLAQITQLARTA